MKIILRGVSVNQTSFKEVTDKKTGEIKTYRNVDIYIPRDVNDQYSESKSITAKVSDSAAGVSAFKLLQSREGQKVSLLGDWQSAREWFNKEKQQNMKFAEGFTIESLIDEASIKVIEEKEASVKKAA